jgi:hypothetical protein
MGLNGRPMAGQAFRGVRCGLLSHSAIASSVAFTNPASALCTPKQQKHATQHRGTQQRALVRWVSTGEGTGHPRPPLNGFATHQTGAYWASQTTPRGQRVPSPQPAMPPSLSHQRGAGVAVGLHFSTSRPQRHPTPLGWKGTTRG